MVMLVVAIVLVEERILECRIPRDGQPKQKVRIAIQERGGRGTRRVQGGGAAGEGEARRGDLVVVHVQAVDVEPELDVVDALVPAGVHDPLPLRVEVVEDRARVVVDADAVPV
jgi:hypothetical protein